MNYAGLIGIALWALVPGFIAKKKGRNFFAYYFLSFLITPLITMIITLFLKKKGTETDSSNQNGDISASIASSQNTQQFNGVMADIASIRTAPTNLQSSKNMRQYAKYLTGTLVAKYKISHDETYRDEYVRRLEYIGFPDNAAINMFMYESMILKRDSIEILSNDNYLINWYFNLKNVLLPQSKQFYIEHQMFLCSEITKIWDEAEWHYHNSHEKIENSAVWEEISSISRYGGGELFVEYLASMAEHTNTPIEWIQKYSMAEQDMLFKYKWNVKSNIQHPYGAA